MGKLINRMPGSCLLISSLPGKASRTLVDIVRLHIMNCLASLAMSTSVLKALPGKLSPSILYLCKPRDVNKRSQSLAW